MKCRDCGVLPGEAHDHGCDVERCMVTGFQWIACAGHGPDPDDPEDVATWWEYHDKSDLHDCGSQVWTGLFPGVAECREFGWFTAEGRADLNRLIWVARWD